MKSQTIFQIFNWGSFAVSFTVGMVTGHPWTALSVQLAFAGGLCTGAWLEYR